MIDDRGMSSIQFVLASALGLFLFVGLSNLVVVQYGRGALQSALEQGVRAGSLRADVVACKDKIDEVIAQLLAGRMSDDLTASCDVVGPAMVASGSAVFSSWTFLAPDFVIDATSRAFIEPPP